MPSQSKQTAEERALEPMAFFPHDSNASGDIRCRKLIRRLGVEGYGRWWLLCELLASTSGHALPMAEEDDAYVVAEALRFDVSGYGDMKAIAECRGFVEQLVGIGLLRVTADGEIYSERMMRNGEYFGRQRANGAKGGRPKKREAVVPGA